MAAGLVATGVMDLGAGITAKTGLTAGLPRSVLSTWFNCVRHGQIDVTSIQAVSVPPLPPVPTLFVHYGIGATFAVFFGLIARSRLGPLPPWAPLVFGLATTLVPALFMFPAMGLGVFGLHAPAEWMVMRTSVINHVYYGAGLALVRRYGGLGCESKSGTSRRSSGIR